MTSTEPPPPSRHDPYAAIRVPDYRKFVAGFVFSSTGLQMLGATVGYEVYERTKDPMALGLIGLARALPVILLSLPGGHAADVYSRKWVLAISQAGLGLTAALLALASALHAPIFVYYILLALMGCGRAFGGPARGSLLPMIVPKDVFHNAVTWNSSVFQFSATVGPIFAGALMAAFKHDATILFWPVYLVTAVGCLLYAISVSFVKPVGQQMAGGKFTVESMLAGMGHVWREKTVLGAISLDLFAVLLGGATALLPIYAREIIHQPVVGLQFIDNILADPEIRYGILRASPYIGAMLMALVLAHRPPMKNAGSALLWSVAGFGLFTIGFGLSTSFLLSVTFLAALGAVDNISVVIRHVLVQVRTPDHLRGRVGAVNTVFIECSNELGAFESGAVAKAYNSAMGLAGSVAGPIFSVVSGGVGTIAVVALIAWWLPDLRRLRELREDPAETTTTTTTTTPK